MIALLVLPRIDWQWELVALSMSARHERREKIMQEKGRLLREILGDLQVHVESLVAVGSFVIRGDEGGEDAVRQALQDSGFDIVPETEFVTL